MKQITINTASTCDQRKSASVLISLVLFFSLPLINGCTGPGEGANPGVNDAPIAYVKRPILLDDDGLPEQYDVRDPLFFSEGGDVYLRSYSSASATETNVTRSVTGGVGDVKDIEASYDGTKIIFSLRLQNPNPNDPDPKWNLYEYNLVTKQTTAVMSPAIADDGNDIAPFYLPDGRIVFSSDRQKQSGAVLNNEVLGTYSDGSPAIIKPAFSALDERRRTKALVLHVYNPNPNPGEESIKQISFNQSHDLDPVVMPNGRILFSRWDEAGSKSAINLYTMNPDGSDVQMYYGTDSRSHRDANGDTIQFTQPRIMSDGRVLALARPFTNTYAGGDLLVIDAENYVDINQPTFANQGALSGPAQVKATVTNVDNGSVNDGVISIAGRYGSAFPLQDGSNRILVSKGTCQLTVSDILDPNIEIEYLPCAEPYLSNLNPVPIEMHPAYGLWIYDMANNTERPLITTEQGYSLTDIIAIQPQDEPTLIYDKTNADLDVDLKNEGVGILNIRSVYDFGDGSFDGCVSNVCTTSGATSLAELADLSVSADQRPARFIRLVKAVAIPDGDDAGLPDIDGTAFGRSPALGMREILGYTMVEPDGSVRVKVPANVAFAIEVLDSAGRRISQRHDNWLQVKPGDTLNCIGCHETPGGQNPPPPLPHGRSDAIAPSINSGAPYDGYVFTGSYNPLTGNPYFADQGDTMAEARTRLVPSALNPSFNVIFEDVWTNPASPNHAAPFSYSYADLDPASVPVASSCNTLWQSNCRAVINYEQHIQPLWEMDRGANTCTSCHDTQGDTQVPAGQLDLTRVDSVEEVEHIESYRELLFAGEPQGLAGTQLVNIVLQRDAPVVDANGDPVLDANGNQITENIINPGLTVPSFASIDPNGPETDLISPSMSTNGANAGRFIQKMIQSVGTVDHSNILSTAELRLISEWLDLGGQYFNNPFDPAAPTN